MRTALIWIPARATDLAGGDVENMCAGTPWLKQWWYERQGHSRKAVCCSNVLTHWLARGAPGCALVIMAPQDARHRTRPQAGAAGSFSTRSWAPA